MQENKPTAFEAELQAIDRRLDYIEAELSRIAEAQRRKQEVTSDERRS